MKFCRFKFKDIKKSEEIFYGSICDNKIKKIIGNIFSDFTISEDVFELEEVKLLTPVSPKKIVCIGKNYAAHAAEFDGVVPDEPCIFIKPSSSILEPFGEIIYPSFVKRLDYEGELAVIIKKDCKNVDVSNVKDYILGYTCLNDVTARDIQKKDGQWTRGKSMDTFAPFGPIITDEINPNNVNIKTKLNGKIMQQSNTSNFIFNIEHAISFISQSMTLEQGDIVSTGTPEGVGPMKKGDEVEVFIEGIGSLINYVK